MIRIVEADVHGNPTRALCELCDMVWLARGEELAFQRFVRNHMFGVAHRRIVADDLSFPIDYAPPLQIATAEPV